MIMMMPTVMFINDQHDGRSEDDNDGRPCKVKGHEQRHCYGRLDVILQWPS